MLKMSLKLLGENGIRNDKSEFYELLLLDHHEKHLYLVKSNTQMRHTTHIHPGS